MVIPNLVNSGLSNLDENGSSMETVTDEVSNIGSIME